VKMIIVVTALNHR